MEGNGKKSMLAEGLFFSFHSRASLKHKTDGQLCSQSVPVSSAHGVRCVLQADSSGAAEASLVGVPIPSDRTEPMEASDLVMLENTQKKKGGLHLSMYPECTTAHQVTKMVPSLTSIPA